MGYKHILLAVDLTEESKLVAEKAKDLADKYDAKITIMHVVPELTASYYPFATASINLEELNRETKETAVKHVQQLADEIQVPHQNCQVEFGVAKHDIADYAKENGVDLIVIGSYKHQGVEMLISSTTNSVINHAECEVHLVRYKQQP